MKTESKRLFISDLPEGLAEEDLNGKFSHYGNVTSVEIKQRKDVSSKNSTDRFAYVNIDIDHGTLQKCFEEFSRKKWKGHYINIQLAKESFLDRLKREREEANKSQPPNDHKVNGDANNIHHIKKNVEAATNKSSPKKDSVQAATNKSTPKKDSSSSESSSDSEDDKPPVIKKKEVSKPKAESSSSSSESSSDSEDDKPPVIKKQEVSKPKAESSSSSSSDSSDSEEEREAAKRAKEELTKVYEDVVVKNNRNKKLTKVIESFGKEPIVKIEKKKPKSKDPSRTMADQKRMQSMQEMKKGYDKQKSAIKMALAKVDVQKNNKIRFDNDDNNEDAQEEVQPSSKRKLSNGDAHEENANKKGKMALFDEESDAGDEDDGHNINFEVKKQFEGKKGQKLMELQSKFKRDHRFQMDERFLEDNDEEEEEEEEEEKISEEREDGKEVEEDNEKIDDKVTPQEKQKQIEILEQVLGKKVTKLSTPTTTESTNKVKKTLLRFNPDEPDHSKYEVHEEKIDKSEKKKKKKKDAEVEEQVLPEVSKETFYEVKGDFQPVAKATEEGGFSLLGMFGRANDDVEEEKEDEDMDGHNEQDTTQEPKKKAISIDTHNPFRYDSSDDEKDEKQQKSNKTKKDTKTSDDKSLPAPTTQKINLGGRKLWTESFFFTNDDYRLQEGIDFIQKLSQKEDTEFVQIRRDLKMIVRDKSMHNERKNRMFKKKLGGGKGKFNKNNNNNKKRQKRRKCK